MKRTIIALCLGIGIDAQAFAQQQQPQTAADRLGIAYGQCIGTAQQQVDQISNLQAERDKALAKIKELETKAEKPKE